MREKKLKYIFIRGEWDRRLWPVACILLLGCVSGTDHTAELCLVNEASLIRIRTLINSPAEFSSSSRRLASRPTAYPSFPFSTEGRMVLALRILLRRLHQQREWEKEDFVGNRPNDPSFADLHSQTLLSLLSLGTYSLSCVYY